jgi:uncharacterized protein
VTVAAVLGSVVGGRLAGRIPETALRKGFGWFVLVMGAFVLVQQAPNELAIPIVAALGGLGLAAGACWKFVSSCPLRGLSHA